jgi:hypothetical protein
MNLLVAERGKGKILREMLCVELGIPKHVRWFEVRFAVGELVTVKCEYLPEDPAPAPQPLSKP